MAIIQGKFSPHNPNYTKDMCVRVSTKYEVVEENNLFYYKCEESDNYLLLRAMSMINRINGDRYDITGIKFNNEIGAPRRMLQIRYMCQEMKEE